MPTRITSTDASTPTNSEKSSKDLQIELVEASNEPAYRMRFVWRNIAAMILLHTLLFYGATTLPTVQLSTMIFSWSLQLATILGVQAGAHRLWAHRSYKAAFGLRLFLALCNTMALQNDLYEWCRDHRTHHRFSETDGDPHNSKRGFFFAHIGWLLVKKHPKVRLQGAKVSLQDLEDDPIVMFQRRFYIPLVIILWAVLPTYIPVFLWQEQLFNAFIACVIVRYLITLHLTWLVNSWAHLYGTRPYNTRLNPVEASIRHALVGEGFHNYHHQFPWDYSASELGPRDVFNPATLAIDFFHLMGWAWDLRKPSRSMVKKCVVSFGDPTAQYRRGRTLYEWSTGLVVMVAPFWTFLGMKYAYIYFLV